MVTIHVVDAEHTLAGAPLPDKWGVLVISRKPLKASRSNPFSRSGRRYTVVQRSMRKFSESSFERTLEMVEGVGPFAIVHFEDARQLEIGDDLAQALIRAGIRLLVLDQPPPNGADGAVALIKQGGPATLLVNGTPRLRNFYLRQFYQRFSQSVPLRGSVSSGGDPDSSELETDLFVGTNGDDLFPLRQVPRSSHVRWSRTDPPRPRLAGGSDDPPVLPTVVFSRVPKAFDPSEPATPKPRLRRGFFDAIRERLRASGNTTVWIKWSPVFEALPHPKVLNAGFRARGHRRSVGPQESLAAGAEYDFLIDVGPRWTGDISLVKPSDSAFPQHLLPQSAGWVIDVVLVGEAFSPGVSTGRIFVPAAEGAQSFPIINGRQADHPGPLPLRISFVPPDSHPSTTEVTGRLCLYYRNTLLQSAEVHAGVSRSLTTRARVFLGRFSSRIGFRRWARLETLTERSVEPRNSIRVDYVLSSDWTDVDAYERRDLQLTGADGPELKVLANFTLNGNGNGQHRIIYKGDPDLPPAFMPFDPTQAGRTLRATRAQLLECFYLRDPASYKLVPNGDGGWRAGLSKDNGKDRRQFKMDLAILARAGAELYEMVAGNLRAAEMDAGDWERRVRGAGVQAGIIQIARTGPANFALPWSLMYEIPLFEADPRRLTFCPSIDEDWDEQGIRRTHVGETTCRYAGSGGHEANIICPYGFWGLRHVVEQPLGAVTPDANSEVRGASREVRCGAEIDLAVGITHELGENGRSLRDAHIERVCTLPRVRWVPPPADDWPGVQKSMRAPEVVYFFCHGKYDDDTGDVYLGLGQNDDDPNHRVYSRHLMAWLRAGAGERWSERRPLVFVNGCHTFEVEPGHMLNLLAAFDYGRASGVIGTEVNVQLPLAVEVADFILRDVFAGEPLGKAIWKMRWALAEKGNLLGLAYTMYALADLKVIVDAA